MSLVLRDAYQLVDGVLDEGLPFVGSYLEKMVKRPIVITDNKGQIHYPDMTDNLAQIDDMFIQLPPHIPENKHFYQEVDRCLYYRVGFSGSSAYIVVKDLPAGMIPQTVYILTEAKLAMKCYFSKINKGKNKFERELAEYLSLKSGANIRDIIKLSEKYLDINRPYFVSLLELEGASPEIDWQLVRSYSYEYLKREKVDVIPICLPECLVLIVPARFKNNSLEIDPLWPEIDDISKYKEVVENRFNIRTSLGIGQAYPLLDLNKSYNEARIALTLPRLMGKKGFVQKFTDLGVFAFVFSKNAEVMREYCLKTLGKLIEYDEKNDSELMLTLRKLVDNNFNRKATADSLFVHINTLHYRLTKIEQILEINLSRIDTRLNLFSALKVYDTLRINGFWG